MIECPICHVMNEDAAHFCAECGQRFGQTQAPQAAMPPQNEPVWRDEPAQPPQPQSPPEAPKRKLKSPILSGGFEEDPDQEPDFRKMRGVKSGGHDSDTGKHKGLRSPLLGGDEIDDDYEEPRPQKGGRPPKSTKGGLRSPLLRGADDDFDDDVPQSRTGGFPHRRSGAEPADDDEDTPRPAGKGGLRSPLLSGGDYDDPNQFSQLRRSNRPEPRDQERRSNPKVWDPGSGSDRPRKLRSPVLGGGDYDEYDDFEDEDDEIGDPNALRSPLLRAVTLPHQNEPVQGPPDLFTQPQPNVPPQPNKNFPPEMPRPGAPPPFPGTPAQDFSARPAEAPQMRGGGFAAPQPEPPRTEPPQPQPSYAPRADLIPPHARAPEPEPLPPSPPVSRGASRPSILNEKLESTRPSFDKFASDANDNFGGASPAVSPMLAGILVVPILAKLWYLSAMSQAWSSAPFIVDQLCSIVVMVCLILVIMGLAKK